MSLKIKELIHYQFNIIFCAIIIVNLFFPGFCFAQTNWSKHQGNPIMIKDTTVLGTWEWGAIGQPFCLLENDTFKMWYAAAGVAYIGDTIIRGRISYAHSIDGTTWIKRDSLIPVLDVGEPGEWDSRWCDTPALLNDGMEYKLYYYGDSLSVNFSAIGVATSPDGLTWIRYTNNPVLERGELLEWDGFWIESPAVLYDTLSGIYSMWYTGVGYGPGLPNDCRIQIGYAYSFNGLTWFKDTLNNPVLETDSLGSWDDGWVSVPAVRKINGIYEMWYIGVSSADWQTDSTLDTSRVGYATSFDGITWTKYASNPVLTNYDPPVDTGGPWAPDVLLDGSDYKMWYETANGICYATAPSNAIEKENESRYIHMKIHPNPFNNVLKITIDCSYITNISIFNIAGRCVQILPVCHSGLQSLIWDGHDASGKLVPSGVYFLIVNGETKTNRFKVFVIR